MNKPIINILHVVLTVKSDFVPLLSRFQQIEPLLNQAGKKLEARLQVANIQFADEIGNLDQTYDEFPFQYIIVDIRNVEKNLGAALANLHLFLKSHPRIKYGILTIDSYLSGLKLANENNFVTLSQDTDQKVAYLYQLMSPS